jgi:hypothetical protein
VLDVPDAVVAQVPHESGVEWGEVVEARRPMAADDIFEDGERIGVGEFEVDGARGGRHSIVRPDRGQRIPAHEAPARPLLAADE